MTFYGLNPSFVYNSPLPLFGDLMRRGKRVETFEGKGAVRLIEGADREFVGWITPNGCTIHRTPSGLVRAILGAAGLHARADVAPGQWHAPSLYALNALRPRVLRTLDWQMTNKRPDWSLPRVQTVDTLQGTDAGMAIENQVELANILGCTLWWCAPPRYELAPEDYAGRLGVLLDLLRACERPPILEYGNELWNDGFPVHRWLRDSAEPGGTWHDAAALEIAALKRVADDTLGLPGPLGEKTYRLFVGGQLTVPSHLDKILGRLGVLDVTPDAAGPALYVGPLKAQREEWEATGAVPAQEELRASCFARLEEIKNGPGDRIPGALDAHRFLAQQHGVPYFACYEAGQSLLAGSHPWRRAAIEAQPTEWMGDLYRGIRRVAEAAGVDLLNWYSAATDQTPNDPRVDVFGLLESTDLTKLLPKAKAARGD